MIITLLPVRMDADLTLHRRGDVLTLNGRDIDLSALPEGASLPSETLDCPWISGPVRREGGRLSVPVLLPHGPDAPQEMLFPEPLLLTADGPVPLPPHHGAAAS